MGKLDRPLAFRMLEEEIKSCHTCPLRMGCIAPVVGEGRDTLPAPRLMLVGEAPGAQEDASGLPFQGRAGDILTQAFRDTGLRRSDVWISNAVRCRPTNNRVPTDVEIVACRPFLEQEIGLLSTDKMAGQPLVILAMGRTAAKSLQIAIDSVQSARLEGFQHASGARIFVTYHPAHILHQRSLYREFQADLERAWEETK